MAASRIVTVGLTQMACGEEPKANRFFALADQPNRAADAATCAGPRDNRPRLRWAAIQTR